MAQFTYIGDEKETSAFGLMFPAGVAVDVADAHAIKKLRGNPYFSETFEGVEVLDAEQPKRRGRPPKAR